MRKRESYIIKNPNIKNMLLKKPSTISLFFFISGFLDHASFQWEYDNILQFENVDLQIREGKDRCFRLFNEVLSQYPVLADLADAPIEVFHDFLSYKIDQLDREQLLVEVTDQVDRKQFFVLERYQSELNFLAEVFQGLKERGPAYVKEILK